MAIVPRPLLIGAAAGAAGTTALNAVTYLDMTLRGRPSSSTPEQSVEVAAERLGMTIPGDESTRPNRLSGLGALNGIATGVAVGVLGGLLSIGRRPPLKPGTLVLGLGAMAASNAGMAALGVSDPRSWSTSDWISDLLPHLAFGAVTIGALRGFNRH